MSKGAILVDSKDITAVLSPQEIGEIFAINDDEEVEFVGGFFFNKTLLEDFTLEECYLYVKDTARDNTDAKIKKLIVCHDNEGIIVMVLIDSYQNRDCLIGSVTLAEINNLITG